MDPDPDPRKEIEVDPELDPERGLKRIRNLPNAVDPGGAGSGAETLVIWMAFVDSKPKFSNLKKPFIHITCPKVRLREKVSFQVSIGHLTLSHISATNVAVFFA